MEKENKIVGRSTLIENLLHSDEPSIRWKISVNVLGQDRRSAAVQALEEEIKHSPRVGALLQKVDGSGVLQCEKGVYAKWQGAHWVLMTLADIGYPKRVSDGAVMNREFVKLHYPLYWHYDILGALKVFAEIGLTEDARFADALDLLEEKELPSGDWPAEGRYYKRVSAEISLGNDYVDWGGTSTKKLNEWVTADALFVLKSFGR